MDPAAEHPPEEHLVVKRVEVNSGHKVGVPAAGGREGQGAATGRSVCEHCLDGRWHTRTRLPRPHSWPGTQLAGEGGRRSPDGRQGACRMAPLHSTRLVCRAAEVETRVRRVGWGTARLLPSQPRSLEHTQALVHRDVPQPHRLVHGRRQQELWGQRRVTDEWVEWGRGSGGGAGLLKHGWWSGWWRGAGDGGGVGGPAAECRGNAAASISPLLAAASLPASKSHMHARRSSQGPPTCVLDQQRSSTSCLWPRYVLRYRSRAAPPGQQERRGNSTPGRRAGSAAHRRAGATRGRRTLRPVRRRTDRAAVGRRQRPGPPARRRRRRRRRRRDPPAALPTRAVCPGRWRRRGWGRPPRRGSRSPGPLQRQPGKRGRR
jgi:hypothetical protein